MSDQKLLSLYIENNESDQRLDSILSEKFSQQFSRSYLEKLFSQDLILLNYKPAKKREKPKVGDHIVIQVPPVKPLELFPQNIPLNILFEDEDLIIINKPSGLVVHPGAGTESHTLTNALLYHCQTMSFPEDDIRPGIVHRLDKETTGVIVAAKNECVKRALMEQFAQRTVSKTYVAIVCGHPGSGQLNHPIGRDPKNRKKMQVDGLSAREAITQYKTLCTNGKISFVELKLLTGRTHQIRVHLRSINKPVLGDATYGHASLNRAYKAKRQLLHSHKLTFTHPVTQLRETFEAPIPDDFHPLLKTLS